MVKNSLQLKYSDIELKMGSVQRERERLLASEFLGLPFTNCRCLKNCG